MNTTNMSLCQDKDKNYEKNRVSLNHATIISSDINSLEAMSIAKAKETLTKALLAPKEAIQILANLESAREAKKIFSQRNSSKLPDHIKTKPTFSEYKEKTPELSDSARQTIARFGKKIREAIIEEHEENKAKAMLYNIPYNDNYLQLMYVIEEYEELLAKADKVGIYWDISEYDPLALKQLIEEKEEQGRKEMSHLRSDYYASVTV